MQFMWTVLSLCLWGKNETEPREGEVELHPVLTEATFNPAELSGTKMTLQNCPELKKGPEHF